MATIYTVVVERILSILNVVINEKPPTDASKFNDSIALTWTGEELTTIEKTVSGITYTQTITWTGGKITAISAWS